MESYIVRIYRRDVKNRQKLSGLVEMAGTEEKKAFRNLDELWEILNPKNPKVLKGDRLLKKT